jgi:membrane-bound lytic murein transglycosylase A
MAQFSLARASWSDLAHFAADDTAVAFAAFQRSAARHLATPYKQRMVAFDADAFNAACRASIEADAADGFFTRHFQPWRIDAPESGLVTGFYEPVIEARRKAERGFSVPFLARPDDLIELDDRQAAMEGADGARFARLVDGKVTPYFDRADIEAGALSGRGLELAFVADPVDAFFAHVQGCARLILPDGEMRVTYDGKSGHAFTGIGRLLVERGEIPLEHISMATIRNWLAAHPKDAASLMRENRSYIFFRSAPVDDPALGPVAAAKVPLTPCGSVAVDRTIHAFGLPFFIQAPSLDAFGPNGFNRLMIAQDTGSAILGAARADLFTGSGEDAGALAGGIRAKAAFHILLPVAR